jgi:predicted site-specific integrase-resolvase
MTALMMGQSRKRLHVHNPAGKPCGVVCLFVFMALDTFLTLSDAAQKFGLAEASLRALVEKGKIRAGKLPTGEVIVSEQDAQAQKPVSKEDLPEYQKHVHLKGIEISVNEAARKYNILQATISKWIKAGYISILRNDGYRTYLDEADVAYCASIYYDRGGQGKWLFNRDGTPYKRKDDVIRQAVI